MREGLDYAWHGTLRPQAFIDAGYSFVCRYLSRDPTKDIDLAEAKLLSDAGLDLVLVWETSEKRPITGGYRGGEWDATVAFERAAALGMPDGRPIYFAVDWDVAATAADPYFIGIRDAGFPAERVGVYGGIKPLSHLLDVGLAAWGWQTSAWSGGQWDSRAHLRQYKYGLRFPGVDSADANVAPFDDFGQWSLREDDMDAGLVKIIKQGRVSDVARSYDIQILRAEIKGASAEDIATIDAEKAKDVAEVKAALGLADD